MRLSGTVTVNGVRVALDWTILGNRIEAGPGLPCNDVRLHIPMADLSNTSGGVLDVESSNSYSDLNVTELRVLLRQRGLAVSGTKDELIARLIADDEATEESEDDLEDDAGDLIEGESEDGPEE